MNRKKIKGVISKRIEIFVTIHPKMKKPGLLKLLNLIALLLFLTPEVFGQKGVLKSDAKKDSAWIAQSIINVNKPVTHKDTNQITHTWVGGKVLYCADGSLKATQLTAAPDTFITTLQYFYHGKLVEQRFDYTDLANYKLNKIYRLPGKEPSYLFLLSKTEDKPDYEHDWLKDFNNLASLPNDTDFNHIKRISYAAVVLRLKKDSLVEVNFPPSSPPDNTDNTDMADTMPADSSGTTITTTAVSDTNSFGFTSDIRQGKKYPRPFLKYDTLANKLRFLNIYNKQDDDDNNNSASPFLTVESGAYQYKDTSFVLLNDTSYYCPSIKSLTKTLARHNYKAGKYTIKAEAIEGYEEEYGGLIQPTLTKQYRIGTQTLTAFNNDEWDKIDLKPDYRIQKNSSLILLLEDATSGHSPGMCGAATYNDLDFWLVDGKSSAQLFSFSYSSCTVDLNYTFSRNGKEITGKFYLIDPDDSNRYEFDDTYWKDNSTYVFVISDSEQGLARKFYLYFNVLDKKNPVRLKAGKLYRKKQATPN